MGLAETITCFDVSSLVAQHGVRPSNDGVDKLFTTLGISCDIGELMPQCVTNAWCCHFGQLFPTSNFL